MWYFFVGMLRHTPLEVSDILGMIGHTPFKISVSNGILRQH